MGRQSRRFAVRLAVAGSALGAGAFFYTRWQLRPGSATPLVTPLQSPEEQLRRHSRQAHLDRLLASCEAAQDAFDILVVGGGVHGLYTAVDAAQRGLRVALVEASDFGSGASSQGPSVQPGAFPFVQRALRQRDAWWLRRAAETMREATIWENVCPEAITTETALSLAGEESDRALQVEADASLVAATVEAIRCRLLGPSRRPVAVHTLIPALHTAEFVEFSAVACLSTLLSPFCGPWRMHSVVPPRHVAEVLPDMQAHPRGGVRCSDLALHGVSATCALVRTAEALGVTLVNYAPVRTLGFVDEHHSTESDASASPLVVATVDDSLSQRTLTLHTRAVINCAEVWADQVRALCPGNELTATPHAFSQYTVQSYLAAPRHAVRTARSPPAVSGTGDDGRGGEQSLAARLARVKTEALQACSTLYSFSAVFALPWVNDCVLLGPCFSPLADPPVVYGVDPSARASSGQFTILTSSDGFRAQGERIQHMLKSCGIQVEPAQLLSCVSHVLPVLASAQDIPWTEHLMRRGFYVDVATSVAARATDTVETGASDMSSTQSTQPATLPFVHVYGGTLLQARLVAAAAVDAVLTNTHALDARKHTLTSPHSRTAQLALCPAFRPIAVDDAGTDSGAGAAAADPMTRLRQIIEDTRAERITDVLFRRTQVAYTSPQQALTASRFIADCLPALAQAPRAVREREVLLAHRVVNGVSMNHTK